jgi:zinc finger protein
MSPAKGVNYTVHLLQRADLDRQLVKSNFATVTLPDLQLTIPPGRGQLTTVEGIIRDTIRDLNISQPVRRVMDPATATKIDEMLGKLRDLIGIEEGDEEEDGGVGMDDEDVHKARAEEKAKVDEPEKPFVPFRMSIDDPSGNSFFQFVGSASDPQWNMRAYNRTFDQNVTLGLVARPDDMPEQQNAGAPAIPEDHKLKGIEEFDQRRDKKLLDRPDGSIVPDEVFSFPSTCSSCGHELETLMQQVNIPYFQVRALSSTEFALLIAQNIIIMATNCYACGYRDNEIKSGSAISDKGKRITLKVEDEEDLSRDLLKVRAAFSRLSCIKG